MTLPTRRRSCERKTIPIAIDVLNGLIGIDAQVELLDDAPQIRQILLARGLVLIGRLQRHTGDRDAVVGREKPRLRREPTDRICDLPRVELHVVDPRALESDGELQANRASTDDGDISRQ